MSVIDLSVGFNYHNYQASNKLSPFEILYGRKCNTPISWSNLVDRLMLGHDLLNLNGMNSEIGTKKSVNCTGKTKESCIP